MDRVRRRADRKPGPWIRRLPFLSLASFAALALILVEAYESTIASGQACLTPGLEVACRGVSPLWLPLAVLWAACAVAVAALLGIQRVLAGRGRTLGTPARFLDGCGVAVCVLGGLWLLTAPWAGSSASNAFPELALHVAYVTSALFVFAATFVDFDLDRWAERRWAATFAVANAGLALTAGLAWAL